MDTMNCRPELHVAQRSRRDKLRSHQLNDWENPNHQRHHQHQIELMINPDLVKNASGPPGLIGFLPNQIAVPVQTDSVHTYQDCAAMFMNMPQAMMIPSSTIHRDGIHHDPHQGCSDSSQLCCTVVMNHGDDISNNLNVRYDVLDRPLRCPKQTYDAGQDVVDRSSLSSSEISSQVDDKKYHLNPLYQNYYQNSVVTLAGLGPMQDDNRESVYEHCSWPGNSQGELVFLPSNGNQQPDSWLSRPVGSNVNQWTDGSGSIVSRKHDQEPRNVTTASVKKGLSLFLEQEVPIPSMISRRSSGKSLADVAFEGGVSASSLVNVQRDVGPLGPFTGYATILKSSRFLKPAQQLLDEFCNGYVAWITSRSESNFMDAANSCNEGGTIRSCNGVEGFSSSDPIKPETRLKKAKLSLLQEEVCRRYKLYNQQMQMVVSSFESVAGLSTATPYISLALGRISKSFQSLRIAITDQLMHISGNGYGTTNQTSYNTKFTSPSNDIMDGAKKQRSTMCNNGVSLEPQSQNVWRPQRGLPERAVSVLRAWLFDHFLHPYPTDNDKQMLATQTGLSRNQVSNWFINARVRVWKPMVEEMHMLEMKAMVAAAAADTDDQTLKTSDMTSNVGHSNGPCNNNFGQNGTTSEQAVELRGNSNVDGVVEKRSRVDHMRCNVDLSGGLMGFVPYGHQRGGFDRGPGNVSLTLGLMHGADSVPQTQTQTQTQTHQNEFGVGRMVHDFVG
ncbi:PREDICTED: BEL1-like homeodomain protein 8 [Tarenaya hassleriana]|uniref:BEL1-like homeodomain protein 8 n=1 Tax=Tarenaya hassleriana TaxID=28532 RepID=UPI00053C1D1A|nr:PREDICTED: BEL1-like homeodomain protein 8 [Tarenaya hassleriana]